MFPFLHGRGEQQKETGMSGSSLMATTMFLFGTNGYMKLSYTEIDNSGRHCVFWQIYVYLLSFNIAQYQVPRKFLQSSTNPGQDSSLG